MEFKPLIKIRLRSLHGVEIVFTLVHCKSQVSRSGSRLGQGAYCHLRLPKLGDITVSCVCKFSF